jgi:thioredoxin-like negative regulator of GroEL
MIKIIYQLYILLLLLCGSFALYENSKLVKPITDANFHKDVMESKIPWYVLFARDNGCPECKDFVRDYESAAAQQEGVVNYGYVDLNKYSVPR